LTKSQVYKDLEKQLTTWNELAKTIKIERINPEPLFPLGGRIELPPNPLLDSTKKTLTMLNKIYDEEQKNTKETIKIKQKIIKIDKKQKWQFLYNIFTGLFVAAVVGIFTYMFWPPF